jgi:D-alanyl-D-alanine carboxypeptidase (penicillin-binding protein 5/6)
MLLVLAAALGGLAFATTSHWARAHTRSAAPVRRLSPKPKPPKPLPRPQTQPVPALLHGPPLLHHVFRPRLTAAAAVLVDARTGRILWARRPHERRPIASTTKIMTAVVALEHLRRDQVIRVVPVATRTPLVREGLRPRERVPAWKLFYGLLLFSGNDDAMALAYGVSGNRRGFLALMNAKARALGLRDTHFTSTSGVIDRGNRSSAWDLAALARYAMRSPRFRAIVRKRIVHLRWSAPTYSKVYVNKNQLLTTYPGADGVKTGWTTIAGHCLVASAHRGGRRLIAVVLHAGNPYGDARRLLNFGFSHPL